MTVDLTKFVTDYLNHLEIKLAHSITPMQLSSFPELKDVKTNSISKAVGRWRKKNPIKAVEKEKVGTDGTKKDKSLNSHNDNQNKTLTEDLIESNIADILNDTNNEVDVKLKALTLAISFMDKKKALKPIEQPLMIPEEGDLNGFVDS